MLAPAYLSRLNWEWPKPSMWKCPGCQRVIKKIFRDFWTVPVVSVTVASMSTALVEGSNLRWPGSAPPASQPLPPGAGWTVWWHALGHRAVSLSLSNLNKENRKSSKRRSKKKSCKGQRQRKRERGQRGYREHKMPGERGEKGLRRWREGYAAAAGRKAGSQLAVLTQARVAGLHSPAAFEWRSRNTCCCGPQTSGSGFTITPGAPNFPRPSPGLPLSDFHRLVFHSMPRVQAYLHGFLSRVSQKSCRCCQCYGALYCSHLVLKTPDSKTDVRKGTPNYFYYLFYNIEFYISVQHSFCTTSHCSIKLLLYNSIHSS